MRRSVKVAILAGAIGALIGASISIAASSSDSSGTRSHRGERYRMERPPFERGAVLTAAAGKLKVSATQLRNALRTARDKVGPPTPPRTMNRDAFRQAIEQHCTKVTDAVGAALNKSGDDVRAAFKSALKEQVDKAQSAGRISAAEANRIKSRIDSDSCVFPAGGVRGCGPGGPGRMGPPRESQQGGPQNQPQSDFAPAGDAIPA